MIVLGIFDELIFNGVYLWPWARSLLLLVLLCPLESGSASESAAKFLDFLHLWIVISGAKSVESYKIEILAVVDIDTTLHSFIRLAESAFVG